MKLRALICVVAIFAVQAAFAQHTNVANWRLMDKYSNAVLGRFVYSSTVSPQWINDSDRFWYEWRESAGKRFMFVDPKSHTKKPAFDHDHLAAALSELGKKPVVGNQLPFDAIEYDKDEKTITFTVEKQNYEWNLKDETLKEVKGDPVTAQSRFGGRFRGNFFGQGNNDRPTFDTAPDDLAFVYMQGYNLFVGKKEKKEDDADKVEAKQLTTDGVQFYEFRGVNYRTYTLGDKQETKTRVPVTWSEDSKAFIVERSDGRKIKDLWVINSLSDPRPTLETYKYAMPGEENVEQTELYYYTEDTGELKHIPAEKWKDQTLSDLHWCGEGHDKIRFIRRDRLQRNEELCEYDPATDKVTVLITESVENAYIERQPTRYVGEHNTGDIVWWSERTGWGHYYLYSHDGVLKNALTSGPWRAENVNAIDAKKKKLYFSAVGREPGENLYNTHDYSVGLDGKGIKLLDSEDADHSWQMPKSNDYAVDAYSRVDLVPKTVLRDESGKVVMDLETMDLSELEATGWRMPERFVVKSADGVTDIFGNMWKPFDFDPHKKYPIILNVYPGPQTEAVSQTFTPTSSLQELAQLGFIVIQIGNRGGTPQRSNAYHSYGYYNLRDYGLADKKAGVEQLALEHPWIDIDRVGIFGHSGGGFMTAAAMLLPPYSEFFKVGVSSSGNHDNNIYNQNWSEQHHGLKVVTDDSGQQGGGRAGGRRGGRGGGGGDDEYLLPDPDNPFASFDAFLQQKQQNQEEQQGQKDEKDQKKEKFEIHVPTTVELAANLKGKLLLTTGDIDNNVHPGNTIRLVNALINANKRFDFMIMPGQRHGYGPMSGYFNNMLKEYFCTHLLGDDYSGSSDEKDKGEGR